MIIYIYTYMQIMSDEICIPVLFIYADQCRNNRSSMIVIDCHISSNMSMTTLGEFHHTIAIIAQVENFTSSALLSLQARRLADTVQKKMGMWQIL